MHFILFVYLAYQHVYFTAKLLLLTTSCASRQVQAVHKKVLEPDRFATKTELGSKGLATTHKETYEAFQKSIGLQPKAGWKPSQPRQLQRYPSDATTECVPSPVARYWAQKEMMDNYKKY